MSASTCTELRATAIHEAGHAVVARGAAQTPCSKCGASDRFPSGA